MSSSDAPPAIPRNRREYVRASWDLLERGERRRFVLLVGAQMLLAVLDLLAVLLLGVVGALAVTAISAPDAPVPVAGGVLARLGLAQTPASTLAVWVAIVAAVLLVAKSALSTLGIRRVYGFLAVRQADVAQRLTGTLFERPLSFVQERTSQQTINALLDGTMAAIVMVLGSFAIALADGILLVVLLALMFWASPGMTLVGVGLFLVVALVLQRVLGSVASRSGQQVALTTVRGTAVISESLASYREITVTGTRSLFRDQIGRVIRTGASSMSDTMFVTQVPRYVFETALVVGAMAILVSQIGSADPTQAVATMTLFLAGGSRLMPSILRLQVALIVIRDFGARALPTYELAARLGPTIQGSSPLDLAVFERGVRAGHPGFDPSVRLAGVSFGYPGSDQAVVRDVDLDVPVGSSVALVGNTGAGKSTVADLVLGVLEPMSGTVLLGGMSPGQAVAAYPGAIGYVPQAVGLIAGSVRENVAFGIPSDLVDDDRVWAALRQAHLAGFLEHSRVGLDTLVGERGVMLSGGQRQRLGIARALYTRPLLLVLDEATSALDAQTEAAITATLADLHGRVTTITIAHRLATVRGVDRLVLLDAGRVVAVGTFDEVRAQVPAFARQAELLGL